MSEKDAPTPHENEPPTCVACGDEYFLKDGFEPTDYCDSCAQELVPELLEALETLVAPDNGIITAAQLKVNWDKARAAIQKARGAKHARP